MKKKYYIGKQFWRQTELSYADNEKVREILKEGKFSLHDISGDKIGELIDRLYDGGVLRKLIPVILKPERSNMIKRIWNRVSGNVTGINPDNLIEQMTDSQIARVMVDFFIFKAVWIQSLLGITNGSASSLSWIKRTKLHRLKNLFTVSAKETSQGSI